MSEVDRAVYMPSASGMSDRLSCSSRNNLLFVLFSSTYTSHVKLLVMVMANIFA